MSQHSFTYLAQYSASSWNHDSRACVIARHKHPHLNQAPTLNNQSAQVRKSQFNCPGKRKQQVTPLIAADTKWFKSPYVGLNAREPCSCHPNLGIHLLEFGIPLLQDDDAACTALCTYNISKYIYILYIYVCVCVLYTYIVT